MTLPLLLSVPHAGLRVPPEVEMLCVLTPQEIAEDGDEGAAEIYGGLAHEVARLVTTDVARAVVDVNRAEDDRRPDGVVKTHTCWNVPVYREALPEKIVEALLERVHRPYHERLRRAAKEVLVGVDGHTMAAVGPPIGPGAGEERPRVCIGNADGTCPEPWFRTLAVCLEEAFGCPVSRNVPFGGGHIIRSHSKELPWVQVEISRAPWISDGEKRDRLLEGLRIWSTSLRGYF